ncbi:MAG: acetyl-CoA carboxylase biotin carboxyl carrier protein [Paracholeplasma sp.]|jgi:acetyl-CoA carboxylase biotin carboxyl carrier protein|nr:acetyl-CoA carboxylase biotin carboxyl carrier protein [Paracholeplasma sp.]MDY3195802.1 acetyl-CoA carboxylase biotin carboxyl carrier protein [Paracholeplasma sp.]
MTIKELQTIIKDIENSPLMSLELEMVDFKLKLSKNKVEYIEKTETINKPSNNESNTNTNKKETASEINTKETIKSPLVGTFYRSSTNNGTPYVEVGQKVKKGDVICIIEAMKIMNEITCPYDGVVKEFLVSNTDAVGFDQALMVIANES